MRKLGFLAVGLFMASSLAMAGIQGSAHDLGTGGTYGTDQICIFCHTPHNPKVTAPLWNHSLPTSTYTTYSNVTIDATLSNWGPGTTVSSMCMACHDGTVALAAVKNDLANVIGGANVTDTILDANPGSTAYFGTDLSNHHPVSFRYDSAIDGGDTDFVAAGTVFNNQQIFGANSNDALVECASCHNPHNGPPGEATEDQPFLRGSNARSAICTGCHTK